MDTWADNIPTKLRAAEQPMSDEGFHYWSSLAREAAKQMEALHTAMSELAELAAKFDGNVDYDDRYIAGELIDAILKAASR